MQKFLLVILMAGVLGMGGWRGYQYYQSTRPKPVLPVSATAQAKQTAAAQTKQQEVQTAAQAKLTADAAATRRDIEAQLKPLKVTSIMLGEPGIVIINKKEYSEGDTFPLPGGAKKLRVTKVNEDGILLAYNGQTFRLDPPTAPDLDALRKK